MDRILIAIAIGVAVRFLIGLIRRAFSRPAAPIDTPPIVMAHPDDISAELDSVCRSPEHGTFLLRGVRGCELQIDAIVIEVETLEAARPTGDYRGGSPGDAVRIHNVCPGRHSIRAKNERGSFAFSLFLRPNEDAARTLTATGWHEPDAYDAAEDAGILDYAKLIAPKLHATALAETRVELALDLFARVAGDVTETTKSGDASLNPVIQAMVNHLEAAPLTKERFSSLVGRVSLAIEHRARRDETFAAAARIGEIALAVFPDEPRLLVHVAELESALGREKEARAHIARARARGLDDTWLARADAVIRECDA